MPWTPEVSSTNQHLQIGAEAITALGTNVPAPKELLCYDMVFAPEGDTIFYRGTGRKYEAEQEQNTEWSSSTWAGNPDYNGIIYPLVSIGGNVAAATHGTSTTAKDWIITPPVTGSIVPRTFTVEQGDSTYAKKVNYLLFTDFSYTFERKSMTLTAKSMSQSIQAGITLTSSPVIVALAPMAGKHVNVYMDATSAALGTTLLTKVMKAVVSLSGYYGQFFPMNRANASYTAHVDLAPTATIKLLVEADSTGVATMQTAWENGTTEFIRIQAQGAVIDNQQTVTLGTQASGTFTLTYKGQTTAAIAYNATSAAVQTAFLLLSSVPAGTTVTGATGGPYLVVFSPTGTLAQDTTPITGSGASLGTPGTFVITQTQSYNTFTHDMAVKFNKPDPFSDNAGIHSIGWNGTIVEDPTWGNAQLFTCTNLITAL